ncbi:MAG: hypothetical protein Q4A06_08495 [Cardiobacteriaceae bacterium]|nr:hypothetical protein [Cardiobacteriaceae bacterium]
MGIGCGLQMMTLSMTGMSSWHQVKDFADRISEENADHDVSFKIETLPYTITKIGSKRWCHCGPLAPSIQVNLYKYHFYSNFLPHQALWFDKKLLYKAINFIFFAT